ncbi:SDR family oxidoreductase [Lujinxingia sediminis]|uniref:Peroxisomal trans-2-enoyl-CoA reductase n=1 Tax=Lujinxingia sediminis TaxID=2480984 RepID=A0ABY0CQQ6_9DELT|nr:SDR family oxidoreductase [Lujinxingia sediminis]RVU42526.1 SDR family oxidoreductase [Lujinxingia sediminis]
MNVFQAGLFEGKVVLITGGGTGIGRALALAFGELGAMVVIAARREGPLSGVVKTIEDRGGRACMYTLDVRDEARVEEVVRGIWQDVGGVDVLVNNAGGNFMSPAVAMSAHGFRTVLDINLVGTFLMSQAVGRRWLDEGREGSIVNISATNAEYGSPLMAHSGASKAGINNLTQTLAVEWGGTGVRVNAVLPGPVRTEGSDERLWTDAALVERVEEGIPLGRFTTPRDVVGVVVFLASEAGAFLTGSLIALDGGERLRSLIF